jgi:hypothetical protein
MRSAALFHREPDHDTQREPHYPSGHSGPSGEVVFEEPLDTADDELCPVGQYFLLTCGTQSLEPPTVSSVRTKEYIAHEIAHVRDGMNDRKKYDGPSDRFYLAQVCHNPGRDPL